jgi:hypothetical protein
MSMNLSFPQVLWGSLHKLRVLHGEELVHFGRILRSRYDVDQQASLLPVIGTVRLDDLGDCMGLAIQLPLFRIR